MTPPTDNPSGKKNSPPTAVYQHAPLSADQILEITNQRRTVTLPQNLKNPFQNDWVIGKFHCLESANKHLLLTGFKGGNE